MDIEDQKFDWGQNVCMDFVKETSIVSLCDYDSDNNTCIRNITAHSLRSLLSSRLSTKAFYFISGRQKHGNVTNGDISYTRETIDFDLTSNRSNSTGSTDCSMFGSPLKLQTIASLSLKTSSTHVPAVLNTLKDFASPLSLCYARQILQKFIQGSCMNMVTIFCNGNDYNKTVLLGGQIESATDEKTITTFRVTADKVKLSDLEQPSEKTEHGYLMTAHYTVLEKEGFGKLILQAKWNDDMGRMKLIKLQSAEFLLHIDVASGCDQSPVYNYYCQLQKVQVFLEGLKTGELPAVLSQKTQKAVIQLKEFFMKMKDGGDASARNMLQSEDSQSTSVAGMLYGTARQLNLEPSVDGDFTDTLWQIIKNCTDISDLVQCLNVTFCALRKGDLKVFVHKANQTTIAKLVRQSYCEMASFPSLHGHLPLRLATEIGMEKIRKDYYTIFINNDLCTSWQWDSFFKTLTPALEETMDMEELNIQSLETQFDILSKLHHCLEIASVVDSFTESQDLRSIAKHVMNHYKSEKLVRHHSFTIPITALQASPEIKKHSLCSIKRESIGTGVCNVISLMSDLPDEFAQLPLSSLLDTGDVSSVADSGEFYMFRSQEHTFSL